MFDKFSIETVIIFLLRNTILTRERGEPVVETNCQYDVR